MHDTYRRAVLKILVFVGLILVIAVLAAVYDDDTPGGLTVVCVSEYPEDTTVIDAAELDLSEMEPLETVLNKAYDEAMADAENGLCEASVSANIETTEDSAIIDRLAEIDGETSPHYVKYNEVVFRIMEFPIPD